MATKKINTDLQLTAKLLDTSGDAGTSNQVLVSTATGINWVDGSGSGIIGGPYLPLSGGTLTGDLTLDDNSGASPSLYLKNGNNNFWRLFCGSSEDLTFRLGTVTKLEIDSSGNASFTGNVTLNSRLTFDYGGDHYFEAGTNSLSYKSSGGTSVMTLNASTQAATFAGDVTVTGDLIVSGSETILNTETVQVEDNIIQLNRTPGSPDTATAATSGITIYRGNGVTEASLIFDDADDTWDLTNNLAVAGDLTSGKIVATASGTNVHRLINASTNSTVLQLTTTGDDPDLTLNFQTDHIFNSATALHIQNDDRKLYLRGSQTTVGTVSAQSGYELTVHNGPGSSIYSVGNSTFAGDVNIGSFGTNTAELAFGTTIANKVFAYGAEFQTQNSDIQVVLGRNNGTSVQGTGGIGASSTNAFHVYDTTSVTKLFEVAQTSGNATFAGDLTVSGGDITLSGTGRIQGIDTVSAGTDAVNKTYVDTNFASSSHNHDSDYVNVTGDTMTGDLNMGGNSISDAVIGFVNMGPTQGASPDYNYKYYRITNDLTFDQNRIYELLIDADDNGGYSAIYHIYISQHGNSGNNDRVRFHYISGDKDRAELLVATDEHVWVRATAKWGNIKIRAIHENEDVSSMPFATTETRPTTQADGTSDFVWNGDNNTFTDQEQWHAGNDGSGSGLDADLLDGNHASAFALSSHNHDSDYVNVTGDTMTGNLTLSYAYPRINLTDTNNDSDYSIINNDGSFSIYDVTNASHRLTIASGGNATFAGDVTLSAGNIIFGSQYGVRFNDANTRIYTNVETPEDLIVEADQDLLLQPDGNVGIGTTSPSKKLTVAGFIRSTSTASADFYSTGQDLVIANNGTGNLKLWNNGSERIRIDSSGNVGIGETNPIAALHINKSGVPQILLDGGGDTTGDIVVPTGEILQIGHWAPSTSTYTDRLRIAADGKVGIGETNPSEELHISSSNPGVRLQDSDGTNTFGRVHFTGSTLQYYSRNNTSNGVHAWYGSNGTANTEFMRLQNNGELRLNEYGSGTFTGTATQRLGVDSSGNVIEIPIGSGAVDGSGAAGQVAFWTDADTISGENNLYWDSANDRLGIQVTPSQPLDVNGTALIRNTIYVGDDIQHWGDGGTGMYFGTDTISLKNDGGSTRLFVDSGGNVGIGETNPLYSLDVNSGADNTIARFLSSDDVGQIQISDNDTDTWIGSKNGLSYISKTAGTPVDGIVIDNSNNVGIGTITPSGKFNSYISATRQLTHNGNGGDLSIISDNNSTPVFYVKGTGTADLVNVYDNTNEVFTIKDGGNVGIGTTSPSQKAVISGPNTTPSLNTTAVSSASLLVSNSDTGYGTYFASTGGGIGLIQQRRQTSAVYYDLSLQPYGGNVGIGTTSPSQKLQVAGIGEFAGALRITETGTSQNILIGNQDSGGTNTPAMINGVNGTLRFGKGNSWSGEGGTFTEAMRVTPDGYVGIGTTSLANPLSVYHATLNKIAIFSSGDNGGLIQISDNDTTSYIGSEGSLTYIGQTASASSNNLIINSSGNVGIGTTSPAAKLTVDGESSSRGIELKRTGTLTGNAYLRLVGVDTQEALSFNVNDSEKVRITYNGNVGIGTTSPTSAKLVISGVPTADYVVDANGRLKIKGDGVLFWGASADYGKLTWDTGKAVVRGESGKALSLGANGTQDTIYINTSQNVGIGTTTPGSELEVDGEITTTTITYPEPGALDSSAYNGEIVYFGSQVSMTEGKLMVLSVSAAGATWYLAKDSTSSLATGMLGIALGTTASAGLLVRGIAKNSAWSSFSAGEKLYLSPTSGAISNSITSDTNDFVRIVGYALGSNKIYFCPDNTYIQNA